MLDGSVNVDGVVYSDSSPLQWHSTETIVGPDPRLLRTIIAVTECNSGVLQGIVCEGTVGFGHALCDCDVKRWSAKHSTLFRHIRFFFSFFLPFYFFLHSVEDHMKGKAIFFPALCILDREGLR